MIVTVPRIGNGSEPPDKPHTEWLPTEGPHRPDTSSTWWHLISYTETQCTIEIFE